MKLGHEIALDPTEDQIQAFFKAVGCARFTYNWGLAEWQKQYKLGLKPSAYGIKKAFNAIKEEAFPWVYESPKDANQEAFADLGSAFSNFFSSLKGERKGKPSRYPRFKKKGKCDDSFYIANDKLHFDSDGRHVVLPVIGSVKIREPLRLQGKILGARIKRRANHWFISVQVEGEFRRPTVQTRPLAGSDLGIRTAVVSSTGQKWCSPNPLKRALKKLRRAQRAFSRRKKGSRGRFEAKQKVAKIHLRVADIRKDFIHKLTTQLARENQVNVIEGLNVLGMLKLRSLARALSDAAFGMFKHYMGYKQEIYGSLLVVASRWFPSSKTCNDCAYHYKGLELSEREWTCPGCHVHHDRDENAAKMLKLYPGLYIDPLTGFDSFVPQAYAGNEGLKSPKTPSGDPTSTSQLAKSVKQVGSMKRESSHAHFRVCTE